MTVQHTAPPRRPMRLPLALMTGALLLVGATFSLVSTTIERLVRDDAEIAAAGWIQHLSTHLPDIEAIASGAVPSPESAAFLLKQQRGLRLVRIEIFAGNGRRGLVSDDLDNRWAQQPGFLDPTAAAVFASGRPRTTLHRSDFAPLPAIYAASYHPVVVNGRSVGVAKAFIDQTSKHASFVAVITVLALGLATLIALAYCIPAVALYIRSKQKIRAEETAEFLAIEHKVVQVRSEFLAQRDELTRLMNRTTLLERLAKRLKRFPDSGPPLALHVIDIDSLGLVNQTRGYDTGDGLIRAVAEMLSEAIGEIDLVGRISGNSFLIVQDDIETAADAARFANRLAEALASPFVVKGLDLICGAAIGVAVAPDHGVTAEALLHNAELALKAAQAAGIRHRVYVFEVGMENEIRHRRELERLVRDTADGNRFELHFQPVVATVDGTPVYLEALLRLPARDGGFISPAVFVPIAEDLGLIHDIGAWVLDRACTVAATWPDSIGVAVNLSPAQFLSSDLCDIVSGALLRSGLAPHRLELEITEGLLLSNTASVLQQLNALHAIGVTTAMDDFGTGYSSLGYLWQFPFDRLKIDRSFLIGWQTSDRHVADIMRTIVALGHTLSMAVTAEGVETEEQAALLRDLGCDHAQGYHFSRPIPENEVAAYLLRSKLSTITPPRRPALHLISSC